MSNLRKTFLIVLAVVLVLLAPMMVDRFWLTIGAVGGASAIAAIGLMVLFGRLGALSLGHSFFMAVGAYAYIGLASAGNGEDLAGLGWPPLLALVGAVALAGLLGLAFSPIARRVKGLYLGVATLALVFIGQHLTLNLHSVTGSYNGRDVPDLSILGVPVVSREATFSLLGVTFGREAWAWYFTCLCLALVMLVTAWLLKGKVGRAFAATKHSELHAASLGVHVEKYRAIGFIYSSMLAGLGGVLLALVFQRVVPEYWGLHLSMSMLAMVVIGGVTSMAGVTVGAVFISTVPMILQRYERLLPSALTDAVGASLLVEYLYGGLVVAVLLIAPHGLASLFRRESGPREVPSGDPAAPEADRPKNRATEKSHV